MTTASFTPRVENRRTSTRSADRVAQRRGPWCIPAPSSPPRAAYNTYTRSLMCVLPRQEPGSSWGAAHAARGESARSARSSFVRAPAAARLPRCRICGSRGRLSCPAPSAGLAQQPVKCRQAHGFSRAEGARGVSVGAICVLAACVSRSSPSRRTRCPGRPGGDRNHGICKNETCSERRLPRAGSVAPTHARPAERGATAGAGPTRR
jgi:hypothetical protein